MSGRHRPRGAHRGDERFFGAYIAIVKRVDDDSKEGGVIVTFPWLDDRTEFPARVSTLYSGPSFGAVWTPEKDVEVVVVFECGDLRAPIIVGCLYNGVDHPPTVRTSRDDRKVLRTKAGHQITFFDGPSERGIKVETKDGHHIHVDDAAGSIEVAVSGGAKAKLTRTDLTLEATTITIKGSTLVKISGTRIELN